MQRIFNFDDWHTLTEGQKVTFGDETSVPRIVVLHLNAEDKAKLFVEEHGTTHFLALVEGRDEVHFAADALVTLTVVGGTVNVMTAEAAHWEMEPVDDQTYATLVERRVRNPELEQMMYLAQRNIEARMNAQYEERERRLEARLAAANVGGNGGGTAAIAEPVVASASVADGGAAGASAGEADGGGAPGAPVAAPPAAS